MQFYVKDIMSSDLITIDEKATIKELIDIFSKNDILGVPVLKDDYVVGVVSASDVIKNERSLSFYESPRYEKKTFNFYDNTKFMNNPVSSIMSEKLYTTEPDDTIGKMAKIMYEKKVHRLLVIEYNKLVGIVSTFDLLKLLAEAE